MQIHEIEASHEAAFLEMVSDYEKNDPATYEALFKPYEPWSPLRFRAFLKECQRQRMDWRPGPDKISITRYVLVDGRGKICGNGIMSFPMSEQMEYEGGNLRFDVPPSQRGNGYGALVLNGMLFEAVRAGMARVLVTCRSDHASAIRAIERNRGEFQDKVPSREPGNDGQSISRFWIRFR